MQIEFLGCSACEVTGSCHYVTFRDKHVLVDCGMEARTGSVCESGDSSECSSGGLCVRDTRTH